MFEQGPPGESPAVFLWPDTQSRQTSPSHARPLERSADPSVVDRMLSNLDRGEAEAIAFAAGNGTEILPIDELEGRSVARKLGLTVRGVLGVLLRAKKTGRLTAIKPQIDLLKDLTRFFIAPSLERAILDEAGE